jgi:hypothetical protein
MKRTGLILFVALSAAVAFGLGVMGCAGQKSMATTPPLSRLLPVAVEVTSVERLNAIAPKPPFQATDVLVFRVSFKLSNPNNALVKVEDLYFEAKVDDGTTDKTIIMAESMPGGAILAGETLTWSPAAPLLYGGLLGSFLTRGVGGEEGVKGASQKRDELWQDLGSDKKKFLIEGNVTAAFPDFPAAGKSRNQFKTEFSIPKL